MTLVPTTPEARRSVIQQGLEDIAPVIIEAYQKRDWEHFGFDSWSAYLADFGQLRLPRVERQAAVLEMRQEGMSQRAIGEAVGVSEATVNRDLAPVTNVTPGVTTGLDGKTYPAKPHVSKNTGENEWYTPVEIIQAAEKVMGTIDLDPASHPAANAIIRAERFFTKEDDGLAKEWRGNVWLNPPYVADLVSRFAEKLVHEYMTGRVRQACLLTNNATETKWWQSAATVANAIWFPTGRLSYWQPDKVTKTPLQGQTLMYFGGNSDGFEQRFKLNGVVMRP